ncbi:hypothetical protein B0T16DRAFT_486798 [Cercophora newfieldiana]|uniref:Uncharacterized protein n=1 Tax=Cercophora newfieldiana TaxID=92897 RepID=A0AA39YQ21_9PEZI|nr:hypothetical protein B0T16DRAFT_486798 [Cercophora newfieldiana]
MSNRKKQSGWEKVLIPEEQDKMDQKEKEKLHAVIDMITSPAQGSFGRLTKSDAMSSTNKDGEWEWVKTKEEEAKENTRQNKVIDKITFRPTTQTQTLRTKKKDAKKLQDSDGSISPATEIFDPMDKIIEDKNDIASDASSSNSSSDKSSDKSSNSPSDKSSDKSPTKK